MSELKSGASLVREQVLTARQPPHMTTTELMTLCVRDFGQGDRPDLRNAWYDRVRSTIDGYGNKAHRIVESARVRARIRKSPDRYFVSVVTRAFEENGWW